MGRRSQAAEVARESERNYRSFFEEAIIGIFQSSPDGHLLAANQALARLFGYDSPGEMVREITDVGRQIYVEPARRMEMQRLLEERDSVAEFEVQARGRDGRTLWISCNVRAVRSGLGALLYYEGSVINISERKRVEQALRESEERFRSLSTCSPVGIFVTDVDGRVIYSNPRCREICGFALDEGVGRGWTSFVHPQDREKVTTVWADSVRAGCEYSREFRFRSPRGIVRWVHMRSSPMLSDKGELMGHVGTVEDITKRKQTEEKLKKREGQLATAQRVACLGSWEWDLSSDTVTRSAEFHRILGVKPQEIEPTFEATVECVHPDDRERFKRTIENAVSKQHGYSHQYRIVRPDGAVRMIEARGDMVADENGEPVRLVGTAQDITEHNRVQAEIQRSRRELRRLARHVQFTREEARTRMAREIHDELGQALTVLKLDLDWLQGRLARSQRSVVERIGAMSDLVDNTISSVKRISAELRPAVLDLGLSAALAWQIREFQKRTGIECQFDGCQRDIQMSRDRATAVFRIAQEALTNVARHAGATRVDLRLKSNSDKLVLEIADNGGGFEKAEFPNSHSLGLLGMRERALVFRGSVRIRSVRGKGTTVRVRIPVKGSAKRSGRSD